MLCCMPRYKPVHRDPMLLPVVLAEQIQPGTFEFALDHLIDHELDLSALDAKYRNDETGASAYDPRVMLKIVLLAYSRGLNTSRRIEAACRQNVLFMALSGDSQPSYTHIAKFVRELAEQIQPLFTQVLLVCDRQGLIGRQMFAVDGVKLPSNASKERSGTHGELRHRAQRLDKAARKMLELHQSRDCEGEAPDSQHSRQRRIDELHHEAQAMREFVAREQPRRNGKGQELKSNVTDNDSAKMATSKGVIQGYAAQAAVDAKHQVIVAADVTGSGSEQAMLLPMIGQARAQARQDTLMTADAGYHSHENMRALHEAGIAALVADGQMRKRDERLASQQHHRDKPDPLYDKAKGTQKVIRLFRPADFIVDEKNNCCICPAGQRLYSSGSRCRINGRLAHKYKGTQSGCGNCAQREQCLRHPERTPIRQVAIFERGPASGHAATELMKRAIDSARGRQLYSQRIATVEPVFANIRHAKRLDRFTLRGKEKVGTQWRLYCLVHNIEKIGRLGELERRA
jgi:transposase